MATARPRVFVTDFGLAKATATGTKLTRTGTALGTPAYMSPEQARGEAGLTPASDVWALGCVLHEALAGRPAFEGETSAAVIAAVLTATPRRPDRAPRHVEWLRRATLCRTATARPPDAGRLRDDCDRVLAGGAPAHRPPRGGAGWLAVAGIAAAGVLAAAVIARRGDVPTGADEAAQWAARGWELGRSEPGHGAALLARALQRRPDRHEWRVQLGLLEWARGRADAALAAFGGVDGAHPASTRAAWLAGLCGYAESLERRDREGDPALQAAWRRAAAGTGREARWASAGLAMLADAAAEVRATLGAEADWEPSLLFALAETQAVLTDPRHDPAPAIAAYDRVLEGGPRFAFAIGNRASLRAIRGEPEQALEEYAAALALAPDDVVLLANRANLRGVLGDHRGALVDAEAALARAPDHCRALAFRGAARRALGDPRGALADLDRAVAADPRDPDARAERGLARMALGDPRGAVEDFTAALADRPFVEALVNRGRARHELGDGTGAMADYDAAHALDPRRVEPLGNRAELWLDVGDQARAIADCDAALRLAPGRAELLGTRGRAHYERGDHAAAIADCTAALAAAPANAGAWAYRGLARAAAGDLAGALPDLDAAVAAAPDDQGVRVNRGSVRLQAGDAAGALDDFDSVAAAWPTRVEVHANRGLALRRLARFAEAEAAFAAALALLPADSPLRDRLASLRAKARQRSGS